MFLKLVNNQLVRTITKVTIGKLYVTDTETKAVIGIAHKNLPRKEEYSKNIYRRERTLKALFFFAKIRAKNIAFLAALLAAALA